MTTGFRQFNNGGVVINEGITGGVAKLLGEFTVPAGATGSFVDERLRSGAGFVFPKSAVTSNAAGMPHFTIGVNSISWAPTPVGYPTRTYVYGTGVSGTNGFTPSHTPGTAGFVVRDDAGNFLLDETFFTYQFIGYIDFALNANATQTFNIPFPIEDVPIIAFRGPTAAVIIGYNSINANTTQLVIKVGTGSGTVRGYFFNKANWLPPGTAGQRWWDNSGNLMGDTAAPMMRFQATGTFTNWSSQSTIVLPAGRNFAIGINCTGVNYRLFPGGNGSSGDASVYVASGYMSSNGSSEVAVITPLLLRGPGPGGNDGGTVPGIYSIIDVTGII